MSESIAAAVCSSPDETELDVARQIQATFVPGRCHGWPGTRIAARRVTCGALGGDFHAAVRGLDDRYAIIVGTVAGASLPAAMAKAVLSGAIHTPAPIGGNVRARVEHLNCLLARINAALSCERVRCSLFYGLVDRDRGTLEFCNAGNCRPLIWARGGEMRSLASAGPVLGDSAVADCGSESLELASLRRLVVYTEGLPAARSPSGERYGVARGERLLAQTVSLPVDDQVGTALQALREHVGRDRDFIEDVTVYAAHFEDDASVCSAGSMSAWFRTYERTAGAAPDSSIFLG